MLTLDHIQPGTRITIAFLACGCHTLDQDRVRHAGERAACPNPHTCTRHHGGWSTITQVLAGTVQPPSASPAASPVQATA